MALSGYPAGQPSWSLGHQNFIYTVGCESTLRVLASNQIMMVAADMGPTIQIVVASSEGVKLIVSLRLTSMDRGGKSIKITKHVTNYFASRSEVCMR